MFYNNRVATDLGIPGNSKYWKYQGNLAKSRKNFHTNAAYVAYLASRI